jgi:hypothetical protein
MPGLGDYEKKKKGERGFKMGTPTLLKMVEEEKKHFLERDKVGPIATKKPIDRKKFEEDTRVMQGMENVREELFSDEMTHDIVKKENEKKKKYPKSYTKEDIKFLEDQHEDVVREEDKK